jgi:cell division protein FtsZ
VVLAATSTWEQIEEPAPALVTEVATPVFEAATFAPELIEEEQEVASIEPEPVSSATEEPGFEEPPPPRVILPRKKPNLFKEPKPVAEKKPLAKQEMMQFEPVTRGRFEKSEPTIVEGQDLDVPTFLRKNVRVK